MAGEERDLSTPLLHLLHRRPLGPVLLLLSAAQTDAKLLSLDPPGGAEGQDGQRDRPG